MSNNYQYTRDLAEFSVANDIRFIYASSAATYGDGSAGMGDGNGSRQAETAQSLWTFKTSFDQYAAKNGCSKNRRTQIFQRLRTE